MKDYIQQNKESWEFNVYDFWVKNAGDSGGACR